MVDTEDMMGKGDVGIEEIAEANGTGKTNVKEPVYELAVADKDKTVSLTLDQVNDNNDELIAMRGDGRYFGGPEALSGPICSNCHRRGHMRAKCKVVVCHACGLVDDHYETQCPKSMVCTNCGKKGHFKGQCQEKIRRTFCTRCESKNHSDDRCPTIWRSYLTIKDRETCTTLPVIYCYNCGRKNHYGDECNQYRSSKTPNIDGSGFSGNNLPRELRDRYYNGRNNREPTPEDEPSAKRKFGEFKSRSGYLSGGNENKPKKPKKNGDKKKGVPSFPRATNSGKLNRGSNKSATHKRGFLPSNSGELKERRTYHKRF